MMETLLVEGADLLVEDAHGVTLLWLIAREKRFPAYEQVQSLPEAAIDHLLYYRPQSDKRPSNSVSNHLLVVKSWRRGRSWEGVDQYFIAIITNDKY